MKSIHCKFYWNKVNVLEFCKLQTHRKKFLKIFVNLLLLKNLLVGLPV